MSVAPAWITVREQTEELQGRILRKFPKLDVEYVDWRELTDDVRLRVLEERGYSAGRAGVHAYLLIRGDLVTGEKAAVFAENEAARIREQSDVVIQVRKTNVVWCRKSGTLGATLVQPGQELSSTRAYAEEKDGVTLFCWVIEPHDHDFGKFNAVA